MNIYFDVYFFPCRICCLPLGIGNLYAENVCGVEFSDIRDVDIRATFHERICFNIEDMNFLGALGRWIRDSNSKKCKVSDYKCQITNRSRFYLLAFYYIRSKYFNVNN